MADLQMKVGLQIYPNYSNNYCKGGIKVIAFAFPCKKNYLPIIRVVVYETCYCYGYTLQFAFIIGLC